MSTAFLNNKYSNWYYNIINKAKKRNRSKSESYFEEHHIVPRCMGGSDDHENLVLLTAREHFIIHILLTKMVDGKNFIIRLLQPVMYFKGLGYKYYNSRLYESARKRLSTLKSGSPVCSNHDLELRRRSRISHSMKERWNDPSYRSKMNPSKHNMNTLEAQLKSRDTRKKNAALKKKETSNIPVAKTMKIVHLTKGTVKMVAPTSVPAYRKFGYERADRVKLVGGVGLEPTQSL